MSILPLKSKSIQPVAKQNVYKYCISDKEIPLFCSESFVLFQKGFRKMRQVYLTDQALYIVSRKKLKSRIPLNTIIKVYVGILSGELFIVSNEKKIIIDCIEGRKKMIEQIVTIYPTCQLQYVNYTLTNFLIQRHTQLQSKQKMTVYDSNEKKIQLKYYTGQKLNLKQLRMKWQLTKGKDELKNQIQKSKQYKLNQLIVENKYWNIFKGSKLTEENKSFSSSKKSKETNQTLFTIKIYPKKFIGIQKTLLQSIWNQRTNLENLNTIYIPSLERAFFTTSNIYLICEYFNGYLLDSFNFIKNSKLPNLISQIVVAVGQLHEAGLVFGNLRKSGIMITTQGYIMLYDLGSCVTKGKEVEMEISMRSPQYGKNESNKVDFSWDWWNLGQLIFQILQKQPFYQKDSDDVIQKYLRDPQNKFPRPINNLKWQRDENLINLAERLLKKNSQERLGYHNDYHEILHHEYFQNWLKQHSKSQIMRKACPPVFKKINTSFINQSLKKIKQEQLEKTYLDQDDWSQLDSFLKGYEYSKQFD